MRDILMPWVEELKREVRIFVRLRLPVLKQGSMPICSDDVF